jgi:hypothetical protein
MSRSTTTRTAPKPAEKSSPQPAPDQRWSWLSGFLEKRSLLLAFCLISAGAARIVTTYSQLSLTIDEPVHFACGLQFLGNHVYQYESQHPPLSRTMAALGPYLAGVRPTGNANATLETLGILNRSSDRDRLIWLMRLGILPFFLLAGFVVYYWARDHFGGAVAVLATCLFTLQPTVLAHAGLATTDMAQAACLGAAFLALLLWAESPSWPRAVLLGCATASAVLSKFSVLGYFPAAAVFAAGGYLLLERPSRSKLVALLKARAGTFALAVLTGAIVIWGGFLFSFGTPPGGHFKLPAPELFDGISVAFHHDVEGHRNYLFGQTSQRGWWYYFPVVLGLKTPLAFFVFLLAGLIAGFLRRWRTRTWVVCSFCLGVLVPSMTSNVNIGIRHVLPIYLGLSIIAALGLNWLLNKPSFVLQGAAAALVVWMIFSGVKQHPDYLAYFNELGGETPEAILVDSNLDWGQDMRLLANRLRQMGVKEVYMNVFEAVGNIDYVEAWYGFPKIKPLPSPGPAEGWNVLSLTAVKLTAAYKTASLTDFKIKDPWFERITPTERAGVFLLYYIPPGFVMP